jgi:ribosomal protein S4E
VFTAQAMKRSFLITASLWEKACGCKMVNKVLDFQNEALVKNGDHCFVVAGTHKGKSGLVQDRNVSKLGHVTISVVQADGVRFKTMARNVMHKES